MGVTIWTGTTGDRPDHEDTMTCEEAVCASPQEQRSFGATR